MKKHLFAFLALATLCAPAFAHHPDRPLASNAMPLPVPHYLAEIIRDAAAEHHIDPNLLAAVAFKESRYNRVRCRALVPRASCSSSRARHARSA